MSRTGQAAASKNSNRPGRRRIVAAAVAAAFPLAAWSQAQQLERVEITGSAIKRTDAEGPAPVEIITRKEIAKTGATSINELVRSIPSIDVFDQGELASNSPAGSGTAQLALRGLGSTNLLVLLNGRRLPVNALYDSSGAGAAFDVNLIPISAIERIEILKDGGSAIYGADAVSGVFNIITRTRLPGRRGQPLLRQQQPQRRHREARQPDRRLRRPDQGPLQRHGQRRHLQARPDLPQGPLAHQHRRRPLQGRHRRRAAPSRRPATWSTRTPAPTSACRIARARRKASTPTTSAATTSTRAS